MDDGAFLMIEVVPLRADQLDAFLDADSRAFLEFPSPERRAQSKNVFEVDRARVAWDGDTIAGGSALFSMTFAVPGGFVPAAGFTGVSVQAPYRRRGVLNALMRAHFEDIRETGEPLAVLWSSESHLYGRYGFGIATWQAKHRLDRRHGAFRSPDAAPGQIRSVRREELFTLGAGVWARAAAGQPGMFQRPAAWWPWRFVGDSLYVVYEDAGQVHGYVVYTVENDWDIVGHHSTLHVEELMAATPAAYRALWRHCLDADLIEAVSANGRRPDEPLFHMLAEPRRLVRESRDGVWARLVDVPGALPARSYGVPGELVLEVRDEFLPENAGRYLLETDGTRAECTPTARPADLSLDVADLSAAFLGGEHFTDFAHAGRADARTESALARADAMFTHYPEPWCPQLF
jgi:predicted acetyltransferase